MVDATDGSPKITARDARETDREWDEVMRRCADLLPFFADLRLSVSATQVAAQLGLRRAQGLERLLRERRLPPFRLLRNWIYIEHLIRRHEEGDTIAHWTMQRGEYPKPFYDLVFRETGLLWSVVATRGSAWCGDEALRRWNPFLRHPSTEAV